MITQADITNHQQIRQLLQPLREDTKPLWGSMNAQQMVEHLVDQHRYTNGVLQPTCNLTAEAAAQRKQRAKDSDGPIPKNFYSGDLAAEFEYASLQLAIDQLIVELQRFDEYFLTPGAQAIHGGFGPMNREEWVWWHSKHFTHHFVQFGLLEA